jgi:phenylpyruvate tautomerase
MARCRSPTQSPVPLIHLRTSLPTVDSSAALLQELSAALAQQTGKPERYVMTLLEAGVPMTFAGTTDPCAFVEIKSIGALRPPAMSAAFCELISARTGLPADRIYLQFEDVEAGSWGWDGHTFG